MSSSRLCLHIATASLPVLGWRLYRPELSPANEASQLVFGISLDSLATSIDSNQLRKPHSVKCYKQPIDSSRPRSRRPVIDVVTLHDLASVVDNNETKQEIINFESIILSNPEKKKEAFKDLIAVNKRQRYKRADRRDQSDRVKQRLRTACKRGDKESEWVERGKLVETWRKTSKEWVLLNEKAAQAECTKYNTTLDNNSDQ